MGYDGVLYPLGYDRDGSQAKKAHFSLLPSIYFLLSFPWRSDSKVAHDWNIMRGSDLLADLRLEEAWSAGIRVRVDVVGTGG